MSRAINPYPEVHEMARAQKAAASRRTKRASLQRSQHPASLEFNPGGEPQGFSTELREGRGFTLRVRVLPWPDGLSVKVQMDQMEPHFQRAEHLDGPPA
jgi:hypothetical protein